MKKLLTATAACALFAGAAQAEDIKLGIIFGFTGPIESLTGSMAAASEADEAAGKSAVPVKLTVPAALIDTRTAPQPLVLGGLKPL